MKRGFTLIEVLMAMGIFLLGMVSVAALFPAAALIQKETITDVNAEQSRRTIKALLSARQFREIDLIAALPPGFDTSGKVAALPVTGNRIGGWTLRDRSYPSTSIIDSNGVVRASFYWVPMVRDADTREGIYNWQVFAFSLTGGSSSYTRPSNPADCANYADGFYTYLDEGGNTVQAWAVPSVERVAVTRSRSTPTSPYDRFDFNNTEALIKVGDPVLDQNGYVYKVASADAAGIQIEGFVVANMPVSEIWFSPGAIDKRGPARDILIITDGVNHGT